MQRANVLRAALVAAGAAVGVGPVQAQTTIGADLYLYSSYVWRGLSLTNKFVLEPDVYLTIPAGPASLTAGGWFNIEPSRYDGPNDISEGGGLASPDLTEFDWWGEVSYPVGKATLTGGATGYIYPNDAGLTKANNTLELYAKAAVDAPLSPKVAFYYDVDKVKGAYFEGGITYALAASEKVAVNLGALAGFNAGQDADEDALGVPRAEFYNFRKNGFTHLDLSAGVPLEAGALSITPVLHLVIAGDDFVKVTSPTKTHDAKLWGGVSISWSRALGEEPEAPAAPE